MRFKFVKKKEIKKLPKRPGVYCFLDKGRKILNAKHSRFLPKARFLYIGKAANIQNRIKNHFQQPGFKEKFFLDEAKKIGFIKTDSEIEALILEAHLIKKYKPQYNVIWKDDKNYFFVGITKEKFPRVFITHQIKKLYPKPYTLNPKFIGPFVDGKALKQTLKVLRKIFPYRSCKTLPKKPCLWYHLLRCPAPCLMKTKLAEKIPLAQKKMEVECKRNSKNIFEIFKKGKVKVLNNLKKEMKEVSKYQEFEKAAKIRDQIFALEKIISHARIFGIQEPEPKPGYSKIEKKLKEILKTKRKIKRIEAYDISNIQGEMATGSMITFINREPEKNFYRKFKIRISGKPNDIAMIKEVLARRLRHPEWGWPDLILIDGGRGQLNTVLEIIKSRRILAMAIAKKKNELYLKGRKPILLKNLPREIFNLVLQLRDEAHRFAVSYHRKLRKKKMLTRN